MSAENSISDKIAALEKQQKELEDQKVREEKKSPGTRDPRLIFVLEKQIKEYKDELQNLYIQQERVIN